MNAPQSDAIVFFGATGDLAYKKIFPALQAMVRRGRLDMPVIAVAKSGWNLDQLKTRVKESLEQHGGLDPAAFAKLSSLLQYIDGDYRDPATFTQFARCSAPPHGRCTIWRFRPACSPRSRKDWPKPAAQRMPES